MTDTTKIESAGYVVIGGDHIQATGATAEAAWSEFLKTMGQINVTVVDDVDAGEEVTNEMIENGHSYVRASTQKVQSASAALLAQVEAQGGAISWGSVGGIACTRDEEDEA